MLCRLPSARSYLKSGKTLKNMKKITLFIMDVGVLDQRFSLSGYWQGKSLVSRVACPVHAGARYTARTKPMIGRTFYGHAQFMYKNKN